MSNNFGQSFLKSIPRHLLKISVNREAFGERKDRNLVYRFGEFQVAHFGDIQSIIQPFGVLTKLRPHLFLRSKIILGRAVAHPPRIIHRLPRADT